MTIFAIFLFSITAATPSIKSNETITFFPTYGYSISGNPVFHASIHGWVYEPEEKSIKREAALNLFRKSLGLPEHGEATAVFKARAGLFLVENKEKKQVFVRLGDKTYSAGTSGEHGHFQTGIDLPLTQVKNLALGKTWLEYQAISPTGDNRKFTGKIFLIGPSGLSVVSDIDDTIKITGVYNPNAMIANTFLHPFQPVPGMAQAYRGWQKAGAVFHYVSGSPWQLFPSLSEFLQTAGFPDGTFHLRYFQWTPLSFLNFFSVPEEMKLKTIEPIMNDFPNRTFIFVGDTAQRDPEVYGRLARNHPNQVQKIFIRNVTRESPTSDRYKTAFNGIPKEKWSLFTDPADLLK